MSGAGGLEACILPKAESDRLTKAVNEMKESLADKDCSSVDTGRSSNVQWRPHNSNFFYSSKKTKSLYKFTSTISRC